MKFIKLLSNSLRGKSLYIPIIKVVFKYIAILLFTVHYSLFTVNAQDLWGLTLYGGAHYGGVLFEYNVSSGSYYDRLDFDGTAYGKNPWGTLLLANDGNLYGITSYGGTNGGVEGNGGIFQYNPNVKMFTKLLDFTGTSGAATGANARGSLIQATDGNLYGMTTYGGASNYGVIFQYNLLTGSYYDKFEFDSTNTGCFPWGGLIQASDGSLYGMTYQGGAHNDGTIFEYNLNTSSFTKLLDFDGANTGASPFGGNLMQANNGKLYGMTWWGGANNYGVLFEYNTTSSMYTKLIDFNAGDGAFAPGGVIQAKDGNLYGLVQSGGAYWNGVMFEYNLSASTFIKLSDFDGTTDGEYPIGTLFQASDGNMYGLDYMGGNTNYGVLFQYNTGSSSLIPEFNFTGSGGAYAGSNPSRTALIEVNCKQPPVLIDTIANQTVCQGYNIAFTVNATGAELSYQWSKGGVNIQGETNSTYSLSNVSGLMSDVYSCIISNTCNAILLPEFTLNVTLAPASNTVFIKQGKLLGDNVTYTLSPGGTGPFTYQWMNNGKIINGATDNTFNLNSIICSDTGTYSCRIANVCDTIITKVAQLYVLNCVRYRYALTGYAKYDNADSTVMTNTNVNIANSGDTIINSTTTDANGYYVFVNLINGKYKLSCTTNKAWGGVNPVDALVVNRTYIGMIKLTDPLKLLAADVNNDKKINPTDALIINRRYIGVLNKYKINDWLFTNPAITIDGLAITKNITAICAGDVNASYIPPARITLNPVNTSGFINISPSPNLIPFDIPVYLNDNIDLGALGIKFKIQNPAFKIINIHSDIDGLLYNITNDGVNIAWAAQNEGYNITPDKPLLYITVKLDESLANYQISKLPYFLITSESVLADIDANLINTDKITIPKIIFNIQHSSFSIQNYPNPFNNITNINYTIPEDANVGLEIYNVLGKKITTLVNEYQKAGNYSLQFNSTNLSQGIYYCRIVAANNTSSYSKTDILMLTK